MEAMDKAISSNIFLLQSKIKPVQGAGKWNGIILKQNYKNIPNSFFLLASNNTYLL